MKVLLTIGVLVMVCLGMFYTMHALTAHAVMQTFSWTISESPTFASQGSASNFESDKHCINQVIDVDKLPYAINYYVTPDNEVTSCVYDQTTKTGSFRYASYDRWYNMWQVGYDDESFVMSFGLDQKMYRVSGLPAGNYAPLYAANFDGFIYHYAPSTSLWGQRLDIFKDIHAKLLKTSSNSYRFDTSSPEFTFKRPNSYILPTGAAATSPNGKWLVFEAVDIGIVRLNLDTLEMKRVSSFAGTHGLGLNPAMALAINNDGDNIFMGGYYVPFDLIHVTDTCGDMATVTDTITHDTPIAHPCITKDLNQYVGSPVERFAAATDFSLSDDGGVFSFTAQSWDRGKEVRASLTAPGYDSQSLEYLAMGDSYSSGEGDTEIANDTKHYFNDTNIEGSDSVPTEMCHISSRSYPFLLQSKMNIPSHLMRSIACSGATVKDDYAASNIGYEGQNNRLRILKSDASIENYKTTALNEFIPGRDQQIEFVKKYHPKAITITGGGNDVQFASIIKACASIGTGTCDYAKTDKRIAGIGYAIRGQYKSLTNLYTKLHDASPQTKIYVVGYPQFITDKNKSCGSSIVLLNTDERKMIREATSYLNEVIEAAAHASGVKYINIDSTLGQHILCGDKESYVLGASSACLPGALSAFHIFAGRADCQESFHPTAEAHKLIADYIYSQIKDLRTYEYCEDGSTRCPDASSSNPEPPAYFKQVMDNTIEENLMLGKITAQGFAQKGNDGARVSIVVNNLEPDSEVTITVYSSPLTLGTATVDKDGTLKAEFDVPDELRAGYHTLELTGLTYSSEPITIWQVIEILGKVGDIDENGVPDDIQIKQYLADNENQPVSDDPADIADEEVTVASEQSGQVLAAEDTQQVNQDRVAPTDKHSIVKDRNVLETKKTWLPVGIIMICITTMVIIVRIVEKRRNNGSGSI